MQYTTTALGVPTMRFISILVAILFTAAYGVTDAACSAPPPVSIPQFGPVMGGGIQAYYCSASPGALSVGDLTPTEWLKHVQVCTTNCSYEPMSPGDPHSMLIATGCGRGGGGNMAYFVEPPRQSSNRSSTSLSSSCATNGLLPPKGGTPAASPGPGRRTQL